jgi:hypothetical protein
MQVDTQDTTANRTNDAYKDDKFQRQIFINFGYELPTFKILSYHENDKIIC